MCRACWLALDNSGAAMHLVLQWAKSRLHNKKTQEQSVPEFSAVDRGIEPLFSPWEGDVLTPWPIYHIRQLSCADLDTIAYLLMDCKYFFYFSRIFLGSFWTIITNSAYEFSITLQKSSYWTGFWRIYTVIKIEFSNKLVKTSKSEEKRTLRHCPTAKLSNRQQKSIDISIFLRSILATQCEYFSCFPHQIMLFYI